MIVLFYFFLYERGFILADNDFENFEPADVSRPVEIRKESEIIADLKAEYRRRWIREHLTLIFIAVGLVVVGLVFLIIHLYNQGANPVNRLMSASAKDFEVPFSFEVKLTEDEKPVMSYRGSVDSDSRNHKAQISYEADYNDYTFKGAVYADPKAAAKGFYYDKEWTVRDCEDRISNFFDFDGDLRRGELDTGSLLRFTGLTSRYSSTELSKFFNTLRDKLSSDSPAAKITTEKNNDGTVYRYDISPAEVFDMISREGASLFYSADEYNKFRERLESGKDVIAGSDCVITYSINNEGYLTDFEMTVSYSGHSYGISCSMSGFGYTKVELDPAFLEKVTATFAEQSAQ